MSTIEGFHRIQDTSPGPQCVHNRGVPLYDPRLLICTQQGAHPLVLLEDGAEFLGPGERGLVDLHLLGGEGVHVQQVAQSLQGGLRGRGALIGIRPGLSN